jgi:hypothetical protein
VPKNKVKGMQEIIKEEDKDITATIDPSSETDNSNKDGEDADEILDLLHFEQANQIEAAAGF